MVLSACLAVSLAQGARGAEPSPEPQAEPDPEPEKESRLAVDLGWDRGITYAYRQRLRVMDHLGAPAWVDDLTIQGRVGGSLYLDGGVLGGSASADDGLEGAVRRARLYTRGRIQGWLANEYKVEFAIDDGSFYVNDFYLLWRPGRLVDTLRVGYFDPPASLQNLVSSGSRSLMEVASPVAAFAPGFRLGVDAARHFERPSLSAFLNLSTVGQEAEVGDASDERLRLFGRLVWRPRGEPRDGAPLLHLGISSAWAPDAGDTTIRYRARPESFLADYAVDTGDIQASGSVFALEAAWRDGPRILQAEAMFARIDPDAGGEAGLFGMYLQASWVLTGEERPYDVDEATFGRIVPDRPLHRRGSGIGALEFAVRLSWLDLSDGPLRGGRMLSLTLGPAWTWNRSVRVLAGYVFADVAGGPDPGTFHIFQTRLELNF